MVCARVCMYVCLCLCVCVCGVNVGCGTVGMWLSQRLGAAAMGTGRDARAYGAHRRLFVAARRLMNWHSHLLQRNAFNSLRYVLDVTLVL